MMTAGFVDGLADNRKNVFKKSPHPNPSARRDEDASSRKAGARGKSITPIEFAGMLR